MSIIHSTAAPLLPPPDNLTIPEFFLDGKFRHPVEPSVEKEIPCIIDESDGRRIYLSEVGIYAGDSSLAVWSS
jgi:4-coumarate--CoA ligase